MSDKILDFLPPMIVGLAFIYMLAAVITAVLESRRRTLAIRARADLLNRVLDKFGSSRDFIEVSESPGGKRLLEALGSEPNGVGEKILSAVQRGVVLTVLGVGVLLWAPSSSSRWALPRAATSPAAPGATRRTEARAAAVTRYDLRRSTK